MMEFFQEPIFTAFVALILSFAVAKIVSFAVSNSTSNGDVAVSEGVSLNRGLRVGSTKGQKRVSFVDDVVIRSIDRYEDSDDLEFSDDQFGGIEDGGSEKEGSGDNRGRVVSEKEESVIVEEGKIEVGFDDVINEGTVEDDDWEGIERSDLEKVFAEAVNYVEYGGRREKEDDHLEKLSSDVQMELYGLHKVAVEGPCGGPQPMALKVSARAKWNAWQRLGSMSQEAAMEQYIRVLSDSIPGWMHDYSADDNIQRKLEAVSVPEHERKSELSSSPIGDSSTGESSIEKDDGV
ncbi:hypothetical protein ACS0TY_023627 [Phlomoides rotata]